MVYPGKKVDIFNVKGGKKNDMENITSHKIAVVVFIKEFCAFKQNVPEYNLAPKYRKDFCMLVLKLIQCPDLEYKELGDLLTCGKYDIHSDHLQRFCWSLNRIYEEGIDKLLDCVFDTYEKLISDPRETPSCIINKSSVIGLYLRRIMLYLNKLSFSQVTAVCRSFCSYYEKGRPGFLNRSLSKEKLNSPDVGMDCSMTHEERAFQMSMEFTKKNLHFEKDSGYEHCKWSRKQAELFTAQQAALLQSSEPRAMSPKRLQETISEILRDNPDYADAHFLSYLNCLRERELCGAMDSLYGCFDRSVGSVKTSSSGNSTSDRNRGFRYASLNLAVLHAQFGHKEQALIALKEAMVMSQEAGDNLCLQQAAGWAQHVDGSSSRHFPSPGISRLTPCARHRVALAVQAYVQHAVSYKLTPANLFGLLMQGDVLHCQHSMTDLVQISLVNRAMLWSLYGKTEMSSICCQLLLNLNTGGEWESEAACLAACGTAQILAFHGEKTSAAAVLQHAQGRAPRPPHCLLWMRTQHIITATFAIYSGKWYDAEQAANQLASIDRWESQLIKAELHFLKGEPVYAMTCINDILNNCNSNDDTKLYLTLRIKAMVLAAQIENSSSGINAESSANITLLNKALTLAVNNYFYYQAAIIEMHIANVQLQLGCASNALMLTQKVLATIMAHGGPYDQARGMLMYVKCKIATAPKSGERRKKVLILCLSLLERVKLNFNKVEAISRIKDVIYLQAQLYNEIGRNVERNKCALKYRQLDEEYPTKLTNSLLTCF